MKALILMYVKAQSTLGSVLKDEDGATLVEYAMLLGFIAAVCYAVIVQLGTGTDTAFGKVLMTFGG